MYIIVVGGGKVGYYLAKTLSPEKHRIVIIEKDKELCMKIINELNELGVSVINGDGTDINFLDDADIEKADVLIAVTGRDQDNLVACQLAKSQFHVPRTIARVNNPKNIKVVKQLGVDVAVSSTAHIADMIEREVDLSSIRTLMRIETGKVSINEMKVSITSQAVDKKVKDLDIPNDCILISIIRNNEAIIPNGLTVIESNDLIIAISKDGNEKKLERYFSGKK